MALRGATGAVQTEAAKTQNRLVHLVSLYLDGATVHITDAVRNLAWDGRTYTALGHLLSFSGIEERLDMGVTSARLSLSGVDQSMIATVLAYRYIDRRLVVHAAFLSEADDSVIANPLPLFDGRIDAPVIAENPDDGTCVVTVSASNHWIDFERRSGRHCNPTEQQAIYPGDRGFEHVTQLTQNLKWGAV